MKGGDSIELEIEIPEELYQQLTALAADRGIPADEIVAGAIKKFIERTEDIA